MNRGEWYVAPLPLAPSTRKCEAMDIPEDQKSLADLVAEKQSTTRPPRTAADEILRDLTDYYLGRGRIPAMQSYANASKRARVTLDVAIEAEAAETMAGLTGEDAEYGPPVDDWGLR